jgi:hypothetical protein
MGGAKWQLGENVKSWRLKEEVGSLNPNCDITSLPNGKLARWLTASCALTLACRIFVSENILFLRRKKGEKKDKSGTPSQKCPIYQSPLPTWY